MMSSVKLKEAFDVESKHGAFYTGGNVEWHDNTLYCQTNSSISLLNVEDGVVSHVIGPIDNSEDADTIQTFTTDTIQTVTSHKSGLLKLWNQKGELVKMWKYIHKGPIVKLSLKNNQLASGGADGIIRIWDLNYQACILSLRGCQGVVDVAKFQSSSSNNFFGSGDDGKIHSWDLLNQGQLLNTYSAHYSKVTSIVFAHDNKHFISSGRDKVLILWEFNKVEALKIIPVTESIETITKLPIKFKLCGFKSEPDCVYVASGGENAFVRVWDLTNSKEIYKQNNSLVNKAINKLICNEKNKTLAIISVDHNIILHHLKSFVCLKQFIGFSDEILDIVFVGKNDNYLAVATNSNDIKFYHNSTMNCQLLKGHSDIVLALATSKTNPNLMLSSSKDNKIHLWLLNDGSSLMNCIGIGNRHTNSVGSIAFSQLLNFFVSVSQDTCLKLWELPTKFQDQSMINLNCLHTQIAHNKDINCVTVSPNDKIIATASQDKTAKFWNDSLDLIGILKGHKRGVWSIKFSPIDQVVVTSSADCTIKLWSVSNLNCLKTIEGHESSVLKAEFLCSGSQILSAGADGLIKLFSIKTSECICTLDEHQARIWALAIKNDESGLITGGLDSILIKWKDVTDERVMKRQQEQEELTLEEQKLNNYLQNEDLLRALKLALKLERPLQVLKIIQNIIRKKYENGLINTINELRNDQKESLMKCAINWNTNSRNCQSAQLVLNILINQIQSGDFKPVELSKMIEGTLPYTERHFKRLTQLMQDLNFINYTVNCMQPHAKNAN